MSDDASWTPGSVIDGWRLERELGRGGQGVVYEAVAADGRRVAIKTLLPGSNARLRERFQREGEGQARADGHPNVLRVHSAGQHAGRLYLVSDLITGGDLEGRLKRAGALDVDEAVRIVASVARGAHHAHTQGVLHRDIKPANVLFDDQGVAKLADFGLARLEGATSLTQTGQTLGTIAYMAPELVDDAKRADARADVYALGALLFRCLSGELPFPADSRASALYAVLRTPAPRLSTVFPEVPRALDDACARALEKSPDDRFASAEAFAAAIEALGAGRSEGSKGARVAAGGLALLVLLTAGAGVAFATRGPEAPSGAPKAAKPPRRHAGPAQPAAPQGWNLTPGTTLRYSMRWAEQSPATVRVSASGVLTLEIGPSPEPNSVSFSATFGFERVQVGPAAGLTKEPLAPTREHPAVTGTLNLITGALDAKSAPTSVFVDSTFVPKTDLEANPWHAYNNWATGAFRGTPFPRGLEFLFARPRILSEFAHGFRWSRHGSRDVSYQVLRNQALHPLQWTLNGSVSNHEHRVEARRETEGRVPTFMSVEQRFKVRSVTNPQAEETDVYVSLELKLLPETR